MPKYFIRIRKFMGKKHSSSYELNLQFFVHIKSDFLIIAANKWDEMEVECLKKMTRREK
jgi:hypothetical protein